MEISFQKKIAAAISVISNIVLITLKIVCGILSGSISVVSEALHSLCDLFASVIAFFSVQKSSEPADSDHQFGHGKFEDLAGFVEALLIILTALFIFYISIKKIISQEFEHMRTNLGIIVMLISIAVNFFVSKHLFNVAKKSDSIALLADAQHLRADIYSSIAVLLGLLVIKFTNFYLADPIFAIIVGILILKTGICLAKKSMRNLVDEALPSEYSAKIFEIIAHSGEFQNIKIKSLKTSKRGTSKNIQLEILMTPTITLKEAHDICNVLEARISAVISNVKIIIHPEPNLPD